MLSRRCQDTLVLCLVGFLLASHDARGQARRIRRLVAVGTSINTNRCR